jgi:hypothetical protein
MYKINDKVRLSEKGKISLPGFKYKNCDGIIKGFTKADDNVARVLWKGAPKQYTISVSFIERVENG